MRGGVPKAELPGLLAEIRRYLAANYRPSVDDADARPVAGRWANAGDEAAGAHEAAGLRANAGDTGVWPAAQPWVDARELGAADDAAFGEPASQLDAWAWPADALPDAAELRVFEGEPCDDAGVDAASTLDVSPLASAAPAPLAASAPPAAPSPSPAPAAPAASPSPLSRTSAPPDSRFAAASAPPASSRPPLARPSFPQAFEAAGPAGLPDFSALFDRLDASFSETLLCLIDKRGLTDAQVYRRAGVSRQHFSKIRKDPAYRPTKQTALALAVALELPLEDVRSLLERAGLALSPSSKADVIVEYFIVNGIYDVVTINQALYAFDQPLLGQGR